MKRYIKWKRIGIVHADVGFVALCFEIQKKGLHDCDFKMAKTVLFFSFHQWAYRKSIYFLHWQAKYDKSVEIVFEW